MPKKNRKYSNKSRNLNTRTLKYADSSKKQVYAKIVRSLGGSPPNFRIKVLNEGEETASLSGSVAKKSGKVMAEDWVLAEPLNQSKDRKKYIIIVKYTKDQIKILKRENKLQEYVMSNDNENCGFEFDNQEKNNQETINIDDNVDRILNDLDI